MSRRSTRTSTDTTYEDAEGGDRGPEVVTSYRGTGVTPLMIVLGVLATLLVVVLAQNTDTVPFEFVTLDAEPSLSILLLATAVASSLITLAAAGVWRRRRRRTRTEREELDRLRRRQT